uniref:Afadin, adherens junction formation factor a n=1 Tax=Oreochromis aureus TaxID=47969 RepID=A0A668W5P1_OREAU
MTSNILHTYTCFFRSFSEMTCLMDLEFHGVMRFYFQDRVAGNFATKCIRVSSTATTQDVIETLAEKFRPDMRMLSSPKYSLYEVHVSGEERQLDLDEKPLVVQLNWNKDDREGRFVLKNENDILPKKSQSNGPEKEKDGVIQNFKRTLSKKEKKKEKRREKEFARIPDGDDQTLSREDGDNLAAEVYKDMPETSFTRTISNPEVVMKRRRQQKLEKRMQEFMSSDGRPDSGGTLRIYADSLKPNIPYKTILLSTRDTADFAVVEALEKYGLEKENPKEYCIARQDDKSGKEVILDDNECPLQIFRDWPADRGALVFQLKKRPPDYQGRKGRKGDDKGLRGKDSSLPPEKLPYLVELSPGRTTTLSYVTLRLYGSDSRDKPKLYRLQHSITEVGSDCTDDGAIQLLGPGILPHHCNLMHSEGMVTVTPHGPDADTFVDGQRIIETTMLRSGSTIQFGSAHVFKFVDPMFDQGGKREPAIPRSRHKSGSVPETTFDLHGDVHSGGALPTSKSSGKLDMERGMVKPMIRGEQQDSRSLDVSADRTELTLPASIEFRDNSEDTFLSAIINYTNSSTVHFKLSPTYVLYMACRYVLSPTYRPDMSPSERTHKVIAIVNKMVSMMEGVIQEIAEGDQKQKNIAGALAFWMANASELLNFIKQDRDLSRITLDAQDILAHLVQMAFKSVCCLPLEGMQELIDHVVAVAENTADELARSDGREVQLEEDPDLQLPFLLPEDGYSCDVVRSLPNGLQDFLEPLLQRGKKDPGNSRKCLWASFWISGAGQEKLGIYIKSVVKGGAADMVGTKTTTENVKESGCDHYDGRLAAGDQLLSVDGRSLVGLSQERAAELMTRTGSVVTLEVAKQGAIYHGLATLLNQPSPMMPRASDRGREKNGKMRPKSEGFELYNSSVQNGSPESPQPGWDSYPEPKKMSGEDRLLKNRADHRSSPNVANQGQSPANKSVYPGGPGTKITSVSTGNLCADDEPSPPRPEAYPIPTQTYPREYFTIPASKSQDRVVGPGQQGPPPHWQGMEDRDRLPMGDNIHNNSMQRINHSQEDLYPPPGSMRPDERMQPHYQHRDLDYPHRDLEYQRGPPGGPDHWAPQPQVSSSLESSTSSQEHLNFSASSSSSNKTQNQKTGPGRWKTPNAPHAVPPHSAQPPSRSDLPPPPPPPPAAYPEPYDPQSDLPLPPPPAAINPVTAQQAADRKKREEQQRWYEKEKARLEEERERKRREQERKLGQIRANPVMPVQPHNGGAMPPPHHQPPVASMAPPQPYHPPQPQPPPPRPEKLASLPRSAVPPPASASNPAGMDTVIRELLPQQQPRTIERRDLQYITISKEELTSSDSLSPDPWKRDAREKAEKQQQLHIVDLLDKEIQELQAKPERTAEENDRLRKLMLEWQFQKRLQESKQSDDEEDEEDDEDVDTVMIMQRLEAEKRARQQTAVPAISVLDLLQDEERRRKQQLEEIRKREAEERAKQEEERRWREEERAKREAEEKRRQEEEYYARLEAERRRQHEEAERKLLTPDEPAGLYRPPLPRDYQPPAPQNPTNNPPPPPQRNTSYLKTQVTSPDTLYTAKFVTYTGDDEDEEEATKAGSGGGQSGQVKLSATRKSYGDLPATASPNHSRPQPPPTARKPRPLSDGIFLSGSFQPPVNNSNSTAPPLPAKPSSMPPGGYKGRTRERREESGSPQRPLKRPSLPLTHSSSFSTHSFMV